MRNQISSEHLADLPKLLIAGNALLTFQSRATGNHLTFHIVEAVEKGLYKVYHKGKVIGLIHSKLYQFEIYPKAITFTPAQDGFAWIWKYCVFPEQLDKYLIIYNEGKCVRCGRTLTTPESVSMSIGPECAKQMK